MSAVKLTLLHAGDILLDTPFFSSKAKESERRRAQVRETFERLLAAARTHEAAVVLFSGNLFDNDYASTETVNYLFSLFAQMPAVRFLIAAGPKDAAVRSGLLSVCRLPKNVTVFEKGKTAYVSLSDDSAFIFGGWSHDRADAEFHPLQNLPSDVRFDLLGGYAKCANEGVCYTEEEIAQSGARYVALSGQAFDGFHKAGETLYAYSGFLESFDFSCEGFGGANLVRFFENGEVEATRLSLGVLRYAEEKIDVSEMRSAAEVEQAITELVAQRGYGEETALRVIFEGHSVPDFVPPVYTHESLFGLAEICSQDRSVPDKNADDYAKDTSVRGELVRAIMPSIKANDSKTKENASRALRITFSALDNDGPARL